MVTCDIVSCKLNSKLVLKCYKKQNSRFYEEINFGEWFLEINKLSEIIIYLHEINSDLQVQFNFSPLIVRYVDLS